MFFLFLEASLTTSGKEIELNNGKHPIQSVANYPPVRIAHEAPSTTEAVIESLLKLDSELNAYPFILPFQRSILIIVCVFFPERMDS